MKKFELIIFLSTIITLCGCQDTSNWTALDWDLAEKGRTRQEYEVALKKGALQRTMEHTLYVGMLEDEFVRVIPTKEKQTNLDGPYLLEHNGNRYVFMEFPQQNEKARVTFENGKLSKFERYGTGTNPWGYADQTIILINTRKEASAAN